MLWAGIAGITSVQNMASEKQLKASYLLVLVTFNRNTRLHQIASFFSAGNWSFLPSAWNPRETVILPQDAVKTQCNRCPPLWSTEVLLPQLTLTAPSELGELHACGSAPARSVGSTEWPVGSSVLLQCLIFISTPHFSLLCTRLYAGLIGTLILCNQASNLPALTVLRALAVQLGGISAACLRNAKHKSQVSFDSVPTKWSFPSLHPSTGPAVLACPTCSLQSRREPGCWFLPAFWCSCKTAFLCCPT